MSEQEISPSEIALEAARVVSALGERVVRGRVRKSSRSGHGVSYLTLCDESGAELRCRWKGDPSPLPVVGSVVVVTGTPTVYAATSELQFHVVKVEAG